MYKYPHLKSGFVAFQIHSLLPSPVSVLHHRGLLPASSDNWLPGKLSVSGFGKDWAGAVEKSGSFSIPSVALRWYF